MTTFWIIALAIALAGSALIVVPLMRSFFRGHEGDRHPGITLGTGIAVALILPAAALTLYARWSNWDWNSGATPRTAAAEEAHSMDEAIRSLERRLAANPDDLEGWQMLGRSYMSREQFAEATRAYRRATELDSGNLSLRADYAEALFLSDPAGPAGEAGMIFEDLVEETPENPKVMWYGGFVALETGREQEGRELWSALLERNPPAPIRRIIEERLGQPAITGDSLMAEARAEPPQDPAEMAGENRVQARPEPVEAAPVPGPPSDPDAIQLSVTLAPGLTDKLTHPAPLFIFARGAGGGPPLAVVRRGSNELPLTIEMSDANAMMQGVKISAMPELQLVARVSLSGSPAAKPGDLFGEVKYSRDSGQQAAIVIDQVVQ